MVDQFSNLNKWKEYIKKMIELLPDQQSDQVRQNFRQNN